MVRPIAFQPMGIRGHLERSARPSPEPSGSFSAALKQALETPPVRMSAHAAQRLESRNIALGPEQLARVGQAVDELSSKGARESLLVLDGTALVVSVPNRTVITAVAMQDMDQTVFTQIDSAVVLGRPEAPSTAAIESRLAPARGGLHAAERSTRQL